MQRISQFVLSLIVPWLLASSGWGEETVPRIDQRFADSQHAEIPDFQRHVSPLMGRLGCNGRACHGSFQGRGGFRLSLFGYDFQADHDALHDPESPRVNTEQPAESLILVKPTDADLHEGGQRYQPDSWEYHVFRQWIEAGAKFDASQTMVALEVTPREVRFQQAGETAQLTAVAVWPDGTREDVTPLCRFQTNDDQVATIDAQGELTAVEPGDTHVVVFYDNGVVPIPVLRPLTDAWGDRYPPVATPTRIDELVVGKLRKLGLVPSEICTDAEFLRRVSLDLTGTLPSAKEVQDFLEDGGADKRQRKIEQLLQTPAYAAWWTTRLCDYTGNNADKLRNATPIRDRGPQDWYQWIYKRVADNTPYDELVAGIVTAVSRKPDQSYREFAEMMTSVYRDPTGKEFADLPSMPHYWARLDFTQPEERAIGFAYSFLGIRIQCAQCHKHPFDQWTRQDFEDFKLFFASVSRGNTEQRDSQTKADYAAILKDLGLEGLKGGQLRRELAKHIESGKTVPFPEIYVGPVQTGRGKGKGAGKAESEARLLGGDAVKLASLDDPRTALMNWLRSPDNKYFARAFVNRVWASYFHRGIVEPPDDLSLANPPCNAELLDYLAQGFIQHNYDMQWLHREITNSRTYQLSWRPNETNARDTKNFSRAVPRRLPAEVAYDAVTLAVANDQRMQQARQQLAGRAIANESVGDPNRNRNGLGLALSVFGQSTRDSNCDCDRSSDPSLLQTVYLQNDREVLQALERRDTSWLGQIASETGIRLQESSPNGDAAQKRVQLQIDALRKQIRRLREAADQERADALAKRLESLLRQQRKAPGSPTGKSPAQPSEASADGLVTQAFLRTVSRYPSPEEQSAALRYFDQAENLVEGARGLIWALINTKEFIVNH